MSSFLFYAYYAYVYYYVEISHIVCQSDKMLKTSMNTYENNMNDNKKKVVKLLLIKWR